MTIFLDAGHGKGNRTKGVYDPGAIGIGGAQEHKIVSKLRQQIIDTTGPAVPIVTVPNDGLTLKEKSRYVADRWQDGDVLVSLHMNSAASAKASGAEVIYDDQRPAYRDVAARLASAYAKRVGLKNRGAKMDTETAAGSNWMLSSCPGLGLLVECGFISNSSDLEAVRSKAAPALAAILVELFGPPAVLPPADAWCAMQSLGVFAEGDQPDRQLTAGELAVYMHRLLIRSAKSSAGSPFVPPAPGGAGLVVPDA